MRPCGMIRDKGNGNNDNNDTLEGPEGASSVMGAELFPLPDLIPPLIPTRWANFHQLQRHLAYDPNATTMIDSSSRTDLSIQ